MNMGHSMPTRPEGGSLSLSLSDMLLDILNIFLTEKGLLIFFQIFWWSCMSYKFKEKKMPRFGNVKIFRKLLY